MASLRAAPPPTTTTTTSSSSSRRPRVASRRATPPPLPARRASSHVARAEYSYDVGSYDPEMDGFVPPEVSLSTLAVGAKIGEGSFGVVYRGVVTEEDASPRDVVVKEYKKSVRGRDWYSFYCDERDICRRLVGCAGVAPFAGVAGSDAYLVWEHVGDETLGSVLDAGRGVKGVREAIGDGRGETASHTTPFAWCTPFLEDFSRRHSSPALPFQRLTAKTFD